MVAGYWPGSLGRRGNGFVEGFELGLPALPISLRLFRRQGSKQQDTADIVFFCILIYIFFRFGVEYRYKFRLFEIKAWDEYMSDSS